MAKETNEIQNKELKEMIANSAINAMSPQSDYDDLAYTKVVFGYLFDIEDHGYEALFKVITDKTTAYFALQGTKLMRLSFTEELFRTTVEAFLSIHK